VVALALAGTALSGCGSGSKSTTASQVQLPPITSPFEAKPQRPNGAHEPQRTGSRQGPAERQAASRHSANSAAQPTQASALTASSCREGQRALLRRIQARGVESPRAQQAILSLHELARECRNQTQRQSAGAQQLAGHGGNQNTQPEALQGH